MPKPNHKPKQILNDEQLDKFMDAIQRDTIWYDFFYTELTLGLRCGELCGLKWEDFDEENGTLQIRRTVHKRVKGELYIGEPKTGKGIRKIILPASTAALLRERKKTTRTEWIFPQPTVLEEPTNPASAYNRMKTILKDEGLSRRITTERSTAILTNMPVIAFGQCLCAAVIVLIICLCQILR